MFDFTIQSAGPISKTFIDMGFKKFSQATDYIKNLPYKRNSNKNNPLLVLEEKQGTCSTKHATLTRLALENNRLEIKLNLGIFEMDGIYSKPVGKVLDKYKLSYIPEAHNYISINGEIYDYTTKNSTKDEFCDKLLCEIEIIPEQIADFKTKYHKEFLKKWIADNEISYTLEEIWRIREECIESLSI